MLHPRRGVFVTAHFGGVGQLKESQHVAAARIQEDVHVGVGCFGGRHQVFGNGQHKIHVQVFGVPLDGFFGVFAAIGGMVNFADFHDFPFRRLLAGRHV